MNHDLCLRQVRLVLLGGVLVMASVFGGGCQFKGESVAEGGGEADHVEPVWRPIAQSLRIYPSTRFVMVDGRPALDARVEFADQMGHPVKVAGRLRFDLYASDESGATLGQRLYDWQIKLLTLEDQRSYYDSITRTYVFRLLLDDVASTKRPTVLRVTFARAEGTERLTSEAPVRR